MKINSVTGLDSPHVLRPAETVKSSSIDNTTTEMTNRTEFREQQREKTSNEKMSKKTIQDAIENVNKKLVTADKRFEFTINEETKDVIIKVIDKETDRVIKEIPPEKILDMIAKMMELAGLFIDERR